VTLRKSRLSRLKVRAPSRSILVPVRKGYVESPFGQLHLRTAMPTGGGFEEETPLVCLHQMPMSGSVFNEFLREMGRDRMAYAPDTPGYGESDAPPARPAVEDYAQAVGAMLDAYHLRAVDLLGHHTGSAIAVELAVTRPFQIRRLVLVGVPVFTTDERAAFEREPWPLPSREDGSHVVAEWQRALRWRGSGVTMVDLTRSFGEEMRCGEHGWWGPAAVFGYPLQERLRLVRQTTLVIRPRDDLWEQTLRALPLLADHRLHDLPHHGQGLFYAAVQELASICRDFLDT